jgi:hypothetical protein
MNNRQLLLRQRQLRSPLPQLQSLTRYCQRLRLQRLRLQTRSQLLRLLLLLSLLQQQPLPRHRLLLLLPRHRLLLLLLHHHLTTMLRPLRLRIPRQPQLPLRLLHQKILQLKLPLILLLSMRPLQLLLLLLLMQRRRMHRQLTPPLMQHHRLQQPLQRLLLRLRSLTHQMMLRRSDRPVLPEGLLPPVLLP